MKHAIHYLARENSLLVNTCGVGSSQGALLLAKAAGVTGLLPVLFLASSAFGQGSLNPLSTPGPTMKSLDQIEARIDLQNASASAVTTNDPNYDFIVAQPGSYYLTANIATAKTNALKIDAANVTLDLNGFRISRASGSGGNGIEIAVTAHGASIRNGSVNGFSSGIFADVTTDRPHGCLFANLDVGGCTTNGITSGFGSVLESCRAHDNTGGSGIFASFGSVLNNCAVYNNTVSEGIGIQPGCTLNNCAVSNNSGFYGIYALCCGGVSLTNCTVYNCTLNDSAIFINGNGSLTNCTVYNNTAPYGIHGGIGSSLTNCSAWNNTSSSSHSYGIYVTESTLIGCASTNNLNTNGTLTATTGVGMYVGNDSLVKGCTASTNDGDGIEASQRTQIIDCTANLDGINTTGSGIVTDIRCVVRHCTANDNQKSGIVVLGSSVVAENTVNHNGVGAPGAGIDSSGGTGGSRIEGNQARDNNATGILTNALSLDVVIRNSAGGPGTAYTPNIGLNFAPIQPPSVATNPMANVLF